MVLTFLRRGLWLVGLGALFFAPPSPLAAAEEFRVVYLCHGEDKYLKLAGNQIRMELSALSKNRYAVDWVSDGCQSWNVGDAVDNLRVLLEDEKTDLIIGGGLPVIQAVTRASEKKGLPKPVVLLDLLDAEALGLPFNEETGGSGVTNLYYLSRQETAEKQIKTFRKIVPFKTLHVLIHPEYFALGSKVIEKRLGARDFKIRFIEYKNNVDAILRQLDSQKVEALFLAPTILSEEDYEQLLAGINERKIPTFSWMGYRDVERGAFAGSAPLFLTKLSRRIALQTDRILRGEAADSLPVKFSMERRIVINRKTANQIGVEIPFDVLMQAEVLFPDAVRGDQLTLLASVKAAVKHNYNFNIAQEEINAASKDHLLQWTNYLPSLKFNLDYDVRDSETAAHLGSGEKQGFGYGISLNQLIFSDPVIRNIINAKKQVQVERLQYQTTTLDITDSTIKAYLEYLRAKALLKVDRANLKSTETNLRTAQRQYELGSKGKDDMLRLQSEKAEAMTDVIGRRQEVNQARVNLNQLMNRNLEKEFKEQEVGLETVSTYLGSKTFSSYIRDIKIFRYVMDISTEHAYEHSPELKALDIGIEQQRNLLKAAVGKYFLPEAELTGDFSHELDEEVIRNSTTPDDHDDWEVQLELTYPLFDGGSRTVDALKQRNELRQLEFKRKLKAQEIEQDLRNAGYAILNSFPSIDLWREAMLSSAENYELVSKKYEEGEATITDLVDAQTQKFNQEANAMIAVYDFLEDLSSFDRQLTVFYMIASEEDRQQWLREVAQGLESRSVPA